MPRYNYLCQDCQREAEAIKGAPLDDEELPEVVFETTHAMSPTPTELLLAARCPRCHGNNCCRTMLGVVVHHYARGYGYLDRDGCNRDMNVFKLVEKDRHTGESLDPYEGMRIPGEKDELATRFRRAGKHQPHAKHYPLPGEQQEMDRAVRQAVVQGPVQEGGSPVPSE